MAGNICEIEKKTLNLHSQKAQGMVFRKFDYLKLSYGCSRPVDIHLWRDGRVVDCGGLENR